jgi:hypothetical protein
VQDHGGLRSRPQCVSSSVEVRRESGEGADQHPAGSGERDADKYVWRKFLVIQDGWGEGGLRDEVPDHGCEKTLAAVSAIVAAGNIVVFKPTKHGSFIQNEKTGSKVWLTGEKGTYTMEAEFLDLISGGVNEEEETREVGFRGPA